jgi:aspartate aminotransferase-like enzyme
MEIAKFKELKLFITGPTYLRKEVLDAGLLPVFGHRDKDANQRLEPAFANLKKIAGVDNEYKAVLFPGTGTNAMEASIRSLVGKDEKLLVVSVGAFGDLYYEIAQANGKNVERLYFEPGKAIDLKTLEDKLGELKPNVVAFTHNETSTGVMNDVAAIGKLIRRYNAMPIVDGVSIFGGAQTMITEGEIAMYSTSTQKCLALPAGLGIALISKEAIEKAKNVQNKGYTTDIVQQAAFADKGQTLTTTPTQLANQLYYQTKYIVEEEGVENRFARHLRMRDITHQWIGDLPAEVGFSLLPDKRYASPSVTCIRVPAEFDRKALKDAMKQHGYLFDPGYSKLDVPTIRIGHIGDISVQMLEDYLTILKDETLKIAKVK